MDENRPLTGRARSLENLKKGKATQFRAGDQQGKIEAGKKGVAVQKEKKKMREILDYLLEKETKNDRGEKITTKEAAAVALIKKALKGDIKAFEVLRDTIGEKPVDKTELTGINGEPFIQKIFITEKEQKEADNLIDRMLE